MRLKLLLGFLLVAIVALWRADSTYSRTFEFFPCDQWGAFQRAGLCNNLHGPLHTVELWRTDSDGQDPLSATHTLLAFSKEGLLIEQETRLNGAVQSRHQYEKRDAGRTVVDQSEWTENGHAHHAEDISSLDQKGRVISDKYRLDAGPFKVYYRREFDSAGREVSVLSCTQDGESYGENCSNTRTEYEQDEQGRATLARKIELPSGRTLSQTRYEYPAENRKRTLLFGGHCRDSDAPASLPTYLIETTYDGAARVIEETTSAPGWAKPTNGIMCLEEESPQPGRVVRQYDEQGHLMDQAQEFDPPTGAVSVLEHRSYSYDRFGNEISQQIHRNAVQPRTYETDTRREFSYEYDQFGNWTLRTPYTYEGTRKQQDWPVEHQKLTYYGR